MKILEYDEVDPFEVLQLNLLGLDFSLTPERVKLIRQHDPRPFPFFALYAIIDGVVAGQVGVFRLPMVSTEGLEDVGGVWAVCTHPTLSRRGIAKRLLHEAHERMRTEGLRFSTLGTSTFRVAYSLYLKQGYQDVFFSTSLFMRHESLRSYVFDLRVEQANFKKLSLADDLFRRISVNRIGFTRRFKSFLPAMVTIGEISMGKVEEKNVWLLWEDDQLVGYFIAYLSSSVLNIVDVLLTKEVNAVNAIASLALKLPTPYIQVKSHHPYLTEELKRIGARVIPQDWSTFMMKPLTPDTMKLNPKQLFGFGTDRFLFSRIDIT
ncbi:MAG: GNAT family N-acetyltransferase [Candidatus Hodarchaeales archaeon]